MKVYKNDGNTGKLREYDGFFDQNGQEIEKNIDVLSGGYTWKYVAGNRVGVDDDGIIVKGPDPLISREYNEIAALQPHELFTIQQSVSNATQSMDRQSDSEVGRKYERQNQERIDEYVDTSVLNALNREQR